MDKGNPKRANSEVTRGKRGTSHLSGWAKPVERGKKSGGKRKRKKRERTSFSRDPIVGVRRSERQSSSSRRELRLETNIGEFRQTLRCRGFSYSMLFLA